MFLSRLARHFPARGLIRLLVRRSFLPITQSAECRACDSSRRVASMSKFEKRLAAIEKLLREIEEKERELDSPSAPIHWGGGLPGIVDLFLSMPRRMKRTEDSGLRMRYLVAMRVALAHFFSLVKKNPGCLKTIDKSQLLELVGVAG